MNLADWLKKSHPPIEQVNVVETVCDALHQAHVSGALRGEIGPGAIEMQSNGCEIVQGAAPVPPSYRAPESRSGGGSGPAAAVFSAGVILYEILAGRNPFPGGSPTAQAEPLRNLRRDLPSELTDAVMACLESDPDWRPKDLSYVLQVLRRLRGNTPVAAPPTPAPTRAPTRAASRPITIESRPRPEPTRARKPRAARGGGPPLFAIAIGASLLIAAGAYYWFSFSGGMKSAVTSPPHAGTPSVVATPALTATPAPSRAQTTPALLPVATPVPATPAPAIARATPLATPPPLPPAATPLPQPTRVAVATPFPTPPPTPQPTPAPTAQPTRQPTPPPPTPVPVATAAPVVAAGPASAAATTLKSIAPPEMPRSSTNFYDLHGVGLQTGLSAVIMKGHDVASGIVVTKQVVVNPTLMRVVVRVDPTAAPGSYSLMLVDSRGQATNPVSLKVP